jgi:hypothetical protein
MTSVSTAVQQTACSRVDGLVLSRCHRLHSVFGSRRRLVSVGSRSPVTRRTASGAVGPAVASASGCRGALYPVQSTEVDDAWNELDSLPGEIRRLSAEQSPASTGRVRRSSDNLVLQMTGEYELPFALQPVFDLVMQQKQFDAATGGDRFRQSTNRRQSTDALFQRRRGRPPVELRTSAVVRGVQTIQQCLFVGVDQSTKRFGSRLDHSTYGVDVVGAGRQFGELGLEACRLVSRTVAEFLQSRLLSANRKKTTQNVSTNWLYLVYYILFYLL